MADAAPQPDAWADAMLAAQILAVDAAAVGGTLLHAGHGPVRDVWLERLRELLPAASALRRVPAQITEERLIGGMDLTATLAQGRAVLQRGVLAESHNGIVMLAMAERLERGIAARIAATLDSGEVRVERDGFSVREPALVGVVLLDESTEDDAGVPRVLRDRVGIWLDLRAVTLRTTRSGEPDAAHSAAAVGAAAARIATARRELVSVRTSDAALEALCTAAVALGIDSLRVPFLALQVARVLAALDARAEIGQEDLRIAARLVLGPRAVQLPAPQEQPEPGEADQPPPEPAQADDDSNEEESYDGDSANPETSQQQQEQQAEQSPADAPDDGAGEQPLAERVLDAAQAAIPLDLLARLQAGVANESASEGAGRIGALHASQARGRPAGVRRGLPRPGIRLSVIDTLRAAAPWQRLRRAEAAARAAANAANSRLAGASVAGASAQGATRMLLRADDFHVRRYQQRSETVTVFIVDASGSSAMHRLAEAKGAVELLLAQCYVRRDRVAVIAFRGKSVEVLLPPTRSLVRARRSMAGLAGGGGTPLAAAIYAATRLAESSLRAGLSPTLVFLTDGRGNLTLAGIGDRAVAEKEALTAARALRAARWRNILIDTSPRPAAAGGALAQALGGVYLPLPYADPARMAQAVQRVSEAGG